MRLKQSYRRESGLTRTEVALVLAAIAIILLLASMLLPPLSRSKAKIGCSFRLQRIAQELRYYADLHGGRLYETAESNAAPTRIDEAFQKMYKRGTTPNWLVCPEDSRKAATNWESLKPTNISYFLNINAAFDAPSNVLAGDRNIAFSPDGAASWNPAIGLHGACGNIVFADGHSQYKATSSQLDQYLRRPGGNTNRILVP